MKLNTKVSLYIDYFFPLSRKFATFLASHGVELHKVNIWQIN